MAGRMDRGGGAGGPAMAWLLLALAGCGDGSAPASEVGGALPPDPPLIRPQPGDEVRAAELLQQARALRTERAAKNQIRDAYEACLAADPTQIEASIELGFFLLETLEELNYGRALELFRIVRLFEPDRPEAVCGEGVARVEVGDGARGEPLLRRSLTLPEVRGDPGLAALAEAALGHLLFVRGDVEEAEPHLARAAELTPRRSVFQVRYGVFLTQQGKLAQAEAAMREAVRRNPTDVTAHYHLSQLLLRRGEREEAERERRIHEILRYFADHTTQMFRQDVEQRIALRRELVEVYPEYQKARRALIRELLENGRHAEALVEIQIEEEAHGARPETAFLAARAHAGAGDLEAARAAAARMKGLAPGVRGMLIDQILAEWRRSGDVSEASYSATRKEWRQALLPPG